MPGFSEQFPTTSKVFLSTQTDAAAIFSSRTTRTWAIIAEAV
jgi:hypothetical protein